MALIIKKKKKGYFISYVLQRIENNKNFITCITGPTGSGKSWSGLRLGEELDPDFNADNVCFSAKQFMSLINGELKELKKGSVILFDEIQVTMGHLDYQNLQSKLLNYVLQTFRHRNFILIVTSPNFNFINKTARLLFHSRIETITIDKIGKQVKLKPLLMQVNQKKGEIYEKYLRVWTNDTGVVPLKVLKVDKPSNQLIKDYEAKKTQFTFELNESITKDLKKLEGGPKPLTDKQDEVYQLLNEGLTISDVAKRLNRSEQTIYEHIESIKKKNFEINPKKGSKRQNPLGGVGF